MWMRTTKHLPDSCVFCVGEILYMTKDALKRRVWIPRRVPNDIPCGGSVYEGPFVIYERNLFHHTDDVDDSPFVLFFSSAFIRSPYTRKRSWKRRNYTHVVPFITAAYSIRFSLFTELLGFYIEEKNKSICS